MEFKMECDLREFKAWSGAKDTLRRLIELNKEDEIENLLNDIFCDKIPTETEINDFLWFETDYIIEYLGLTEEKFYN